MTNMTEVALYKVLRASEHLIEKWLHEGVNSYEFSESMRELAIRSDQARKLIKDETLGRK